ncbi:hypothetical protein P280DRAFT_28625 [Massarina eburnea CBS 473.64]|uniref:Uncharacterized protein n=1 Tax=Massarina eburnea CBS 473.64 TaxID=1395130 RepID=A0A6A6RXU3_9PLEO|nr:hypothetical protein P280DRAFT_28625 [Massarina eburnea CBS 473.64]
MVMMLNSCASLQTNKVHSPRRLELLHFLPYLPSDPAIKSLSVCLSLTMYMRSVKNLPARLDCTDAKNNSRISIPCCVPIECGSATLVTDDFPSHRLMNSISWDSLQTV